MVWQAWMGEVRSVEDGLVLVRQVRCGEVRSGLVGFGLVWCGAVR